MRDTSAALSVLNNQSRNITTIEDPIEYHIDGINQTQINDNIKMSFAKVDANKNGSTPISLRRIMASFALFVCRVEKTKCPVKLA
jgi:hypothetical protein